MGTALLKDKIFAMVKNLTDEQLLLVNDFVGLLEKAQLKKQKVKSKKKESKRDMTPVIEIQKLFHEIGITSLVDDVIREREDRL